jgi:hypothetical protein
MSLKLEPTTIINVDSSSFEVSKMSAEVQQMIKYFDDWRQKEVDLTSNLLMVRGAIRDIQNTLLETITKELEAAKVKAVAPAEDVTDVAPAPVKRIKRTAK